MRIAKAIWLLILLLLITIVSGLLWLLSTSYTDILDIAIHQIQRPDLRSVLENQYFTQANFIRLQRSGLSFIFIIVGLIGFGIILRKKIINFIDIVTHRVQSLFLAVISSLKSSRKLTQIMLASIVLIILIRSVYYAWHFYPQYDECWNYNYFLSNNIISSIFAYNNYPLHNLISYIFLTILPDNTFSMRLPNIILGAVNIILIFSLVKNIFKKELLAIAAAALFAVLPTTVFYMLFARGIMLALLFAIVTLFYLLSKRLENCTLTDCFVLVIAGGLGCYSMISFSIYLGVIFIVGGVQSILNQNWKGLKKISVTALITALFSFFLYSPIMLGTGLNLGASSGYFFNEFNWHDWLNKAQFISRNQIGFYLGAYIFLGLNTLLLFFSKRRLIIVLNIVLLLIPFIFPIIFKTYLPARAISFQAFAYLFTLLLVLEILYNKTNKLTFTIATSVLVLGLNYIAITHTFFTWSSRLDKGVFEIANVFQKNNVKTYYDRSGAFQYFVPGILYHHKISDKIITFHSSDTSSSRFTPIDKFKGNTFICRKSNFSPSEYNEILHEYLDEDRAFIIYRKSRINFR